jgi:hypothetical protein
MGGTCEFIRRDAIVGDVCWIVGVVGECRWLHHGHKIVRLVSIFPRLLL